MVANLHICVCGSFRVMVSVLSFGQVSTLGVNTCMEVLEAALQ